MNGIRAQANNFILDGIDNNEALVNTIVIFPPADAIQEFRVQTNIAPAEFGRAGGALVVTSIKSGTNDYHGSVFWFNRNKELNAKNFFDSGPTPGFVRNQFGGSAGGPIIKNKLFIFGDYQGLRQAVPSGPSYATVPTDLMRMGDFSELLNPSLHYRTHRCRPAALSMTRQPTARCLPQLPIPTALCNSWAMAHSRTSSLRIGINHRGHCLPQRLPRAELRTHARHSGLELRFPLSQFQAGAQRHRKLG